MPFQLPILPYHHGDLAPAISKEQTLDLVVNVATDPGVYPLKISLVYENGALLRGLFVVEP